MARRWSLEYRDDIKQLERAFDTIGKDKLGDAFKAIGREYVDLVKKSFDQSKDPYGRRWKPLADSTIRQRSGSKPLVRTGALRNSIRYDANNDRVELYSTLDYARYHQGGSRAGRGDHVPRRPFLPTERGLPTRWRQAALDAILDLLDE